MTEPFKLYISAAAELADERDLLGKSIAELPVDFGWRISFSPDKNDPLDIDLVYQADLHILLLGTDIRAPIGHEYQQALSAGRNPIAFLKMRVIRTPAADEFVRYARNFSHWRPFESGQELLQSALPMIIERILAKADTFILTPVEIDELGKRLRKLQDFGSGRDENVRGGAGQSGLILSLDRFKPSEGIPIESDEL